MSPTEQLHITNTDADKASPENFEAVQITDPDLLEQLETVKNFPLKVRTSTENRLKRAQAERNETTKRRTAMTPIERRRDITREEISENALEREDIQHIHSVLGLCALPYKRPQDDVTDYQAQYGLMSLNVQSGSLIDPNTGKWVKQGIPYGTKARLMQFHICTRALRQKSPIVELEDNMSAFIHTLGFPVSGGKNGTVNLFKEQLNRLAACRLQIGVWNGRDRSKTVNMQPIESLEVWFPKSPEQQMLWPSKVVLSQEFYNSLVEHALPVDMRALSCLSHSAKQMDIMLWLSYRLKFLQKDYFLTWDLLQGQFCQSPTMRRRDFQKKFKQDLRDIQEMYTTPLPVKLTEKGMLLSPPTSETLFVPRETTKRKRR